MVIDSKREKRHKNEGSTDDSGEGDKITENGGWREQVPVYVWGIEGQWALRIDQNLYIHPCWQHCKSKQQVLNNAGKREGNREGRR